MKCDDLQCILLQESWFSEVEESLTNECLCDIPYLFDMLDQNEEDMLNIENMPASSDSLLERTARIALLSDRPPRLSLTVPLLSKNVINWLSCFFPVELSACCRLD